MNSDINNSIMKDDNEELFDISNANIAISKLKSTQIKHLPDSQPSNNISLMAQCYASGRKKKIFTIILEKFYSKISRAAPKSEYVNTGIIRAIKRIFRNVENGTVPKKTCIAIDVKNSSESQIWSQLLKIYRENPDKIKYFSQTINGPLTDGKAKRKVLNINDEKCFTNLFCKNFFSNSSMQSAFYLFISLIFLENNPDRFCSRFGFYCCRNNERTITHNYECELKWEELHNYFLYKYFEELGIERLV